MTYKMIVMMCCTMLFNLSAMQRQTDWQNAQDYVDLLVQDLVKRDNKNSIVIVPFKTNALEDTAAKRKESETMLSEIALHGVRICLELNFPKAGKSFLVVDNKVDDDEESPTHSQAWLCKKVDAKMTKCSIDCRSTDESSFIVYNMPHYNQNEGCFDWAYGDDLCDLLRDRNEPCLVLIDEDIYNKKENIVDEIYRRFYGKKEVLQYDKKSQKYTVYKPSFLSEIPFSMVLLWGALATVGLYYVMPSGLATALNANL